MKKVIYALILPLIVVSGLVFANREIKNEPSKQATPKQLSAAESKTEREKWEATPEGIKYEKWKASPEGKKVFAGAAKIKNQISAFTNMEAVVTSLTLPPGSRLGFGVMARIDGVDYILKFDPEKSDLSFLTFNNAFQQLHSLKVNDKIIIRSHTVSHAPKYSYPIVTGDYVERDHKIIYKRAPPQRWMLSIAATILNSEISGIFEKRFNMASALKYMVDEKGKKTSVLVPLKIWEKINKDYHKLQNKLNVLTGIKAG